MITSFEYHIYILQASYEDIYMRIGLYYIRHILHYFFDMRQKNIYKSRVRVARFSTSFESSRNSAVRLLANFRESGIVFPLSLSFLS